MSAHKHILVVDDERDLTELLTYNLKKAGYHVSVAFSGRQALESVASHVPDLILLDVMLPEFSGTEIANRVRTNPKTAGVPIIMVTAKGEELDQVVGLTVGADDYISKPFSMKVLLARVEAVLRRSSRARPESPNLTLGPIEVNVETHEAFVSGQALKLTLTEFRILTSLIQADGKILSRATLMTKAMGPGVTVTERTIDVHVTAIRKKLGEYGSMIRTVRGVGYRAIPEVDSATVGEGEETSS